MGMALDHNMLLSWKLRARSELSTSIDNGENTGIYPQAERTTDSRKYIHKRA